MKFQLKNIQPLLLIMMLSWAPTGYAQNASVEELDYIVAIVGEDVIVYSELNAETERIIQQLAGRGKLPPREALEPQVLERLIVRKLQLAAAERNGIRVSEDILAQMVGNVAKRNQLTMSEFREALEADGMSFSEYRRIIKDEITIKQLLEKEVLGRIRVTDQEIKAFSARSGSSTGQRSAYRLMHILIAAPEGASPEQLAVSRRKAERLVKELRSGRNFRSAALVESDGQQALEGGDLGWRPGNELPTIFADKVVTMQRGDISDPIHSPSGYHIIQLEDFKGGERHMVDQTRARQILVVTNEITSDDEARTRLEQLKKRIDGGDDFAALARSHSDDRSTALEGGDLGWLTPGAMLPDFEAQMDKLGINEVSQPFRTEFGWHIVQILERRKHDSTEEVQKAEALSAIRERKFTEETNLYLRRLRDEAFVDIRLNQIDR
ncbi:MAG: molecular chaperone SurA [Gammaproteobacteria bacterium]|nr:molecular chaperone SurA [Gammaproteobacteria bacterium]